MSGVSRVGVQAGGGIVARFGNSVIVADATSGLETFTNVVLAELDSPSVSAADVAWRIAELLIQNRPDAPAFGAVICLPDGYQVLLHGSVRALINDDTELLGAGALTWVDRPIHEPVKQLAVTLAPDGPVLADPRTDLRGGLVPGGGFVLTPSAPAAITDAVPEPAPEPAPQFAPRHASEVAPEPEPEPEPESTLEPVLVPGFEPAVEPEPEPAPVWTPPPLPTQADVDAPTSVLEPLLTEPSGASSEPAAEAPAEAPAEVPVEAPAEAAYEPFTPQEAAFVPEATRDFPSVSRSQVRETVAITDVITSLMADDGTRTPLDRSYVFGREPQQDPLVANGEASPIRLQDPEQLISRVQAYLHVDENGVTIRDAKSANGTYIAAPGASDWTKLEEEAAPLPVGWSIRMGRRVFTHFGVNQ